MNTDTTQNKTTGVDCEETAQIRLSDYKKLVKLGIIAENCLSIDDTCRQTNIGTSNYSTHFIQPWAIWLDYPELTPFDHDIIKRVLRTKENESRVTEYKKIIHICCERLRQLTGENYSLISSTYYNSLLKKSIQ